MMLRLASGSENFPFGLATVCYIEVGADGGVTSPPEERVQDRVRRGESRLYAVWPGHYRSDLFFIDDIDEYEKALGLQHDPVRTGLQEHKHQVRWSISPSEDRPTGAYVSVEARLDCGCEVRDLRTFARHMRDQRGWDIATTAAWDTSSPPKDANTRPKYTFRIRRRSLA